MTESKEPKESKFFRIRIRSIFPETPTEFNLYVFINGRHVLYLHAGDKLTTDKLKTLENHPGAAFYIQEKDIPFYKKYIHGEVNSDRLDPRQKAVILRESSYALVEELYENPDVNKALDESKEVINGFVSFMDAVPEGMAHLISLSSHDFYTYNHSLDVGIYCLGIARAQNYNARDLLEIGQGALFHDVGKRMVSVDIICKAGPLDDMEWAQMSRHPQFGLKILNENGNVSDAIKACCFEHHENFLGTGYPQALKGPDIHPYARMVALADTYDALTTKRSYNKPMMPKDALNFMNQKLMDRFDPELLKAFTSVLFKLGN